MPVRSGTCRPRSVTSSRLTARDSALADDVAGLRRHCGQPTDRRDRLTRGRLRRPRRRCRHSAQGTARGGGVPPAQGPRGTQAHHASLHRRRAVRLRPRPSDVRGLGHSVRSGAARSGSADPQPSRPAHAGHHRDDRLADEPASRNRTSRRPRSAWTALGQKPAEQLRQARPRDSTQGRRDPERCPPRPGPSAQPAHVGPERTRPDRLRDQRGPLASAATTAAGGDPDVASPPPPQLGGREARLESTSSAISWAAIPCPTSSR